MTTEDKNKDKLLVEEFKNGNEKAFDELINLHASKLYQTAYGLLGNKEDAEEVVQDAFVRAYRAIGQFRGDSSFETWVYRIVVNLSRNKYMWNKRRGSEAKLSLTQTAEINPDAEAMEEIQVPDTTMSPDAAMEKKEFEHSLTQGFNKLPGTLKETMVMRHINDLSYDEIAEVLDCNIGTVKSRIARGRELLREFFSKLDGIKTEADK